MVLFIKIVGEVGFLDESKDLIIKGKEVVREIVEKMWYFVQYRLFKFY